MAIRKTLRAHWLYLSYVVRHKYWVFRKGLVTKVPLWRLIVHDWSKFLPSEWFPYVNYFYGGGNGVQQHRENGGHYDPTQGPLAFNVAWLKHQHRQPHHWQHWVLREDSGAMKPLPMPLHFVNEMVADWAGAGRAQGHGDDVEPWFRKNRDKMVLHYTTEQNVELALERLRDHHEAIAQRVRVLGY